MPAWDNGNDMWHAWTQKIQLSGPTVYSLYFDLVGRIESPDKNLVRPAQWRKWSNDLLYQLTLRNLVCIVTPGLVIHCCIL